MIEDRSATLSMDTEHVEVVYVPSDYQRSCLNNDAYERLLGTLHYNEDEDTFYRHLILIKQVEERNGKLDLLSALWSEDSHIGSFRLADGSA